MHKAQGKEKKMAYKHAKVPNAFGTDIYTIWTTLEDGFATVITVRQGNHTRIEVMPWLFRSTAEEFMDKELHRYDLLEIGASGRVVELEEVNA